MLAGGKNGIPHMMNMASIKILNTKYWQHENNNEEY